MGRRPSHSPSRSHGQSHGKYGIWGKMGSVYSPKKKHYARIGSSEAFNAIAHELPRDAEWRKRVTFMARQRSNPHADKFRALLE